MNKLKLFAFIFIFSIVAPLHTTHALVTERAKYALGPAFNINDSSAFVSGILFSTLVERIPLINTIVKWYWPFIPSIEVAPVGIYGQNQTPFFGAQGSKTAVLSQQTGTGPFLGQITGLFCDTSYDYTISAVIPSAANIAITNALKLYGTYSEATVGVASKVFNTSPCTKPSIIMTNALPQNNFQARLIADANVYNARSAVIEFDYGTASKNYTQNITATIEKHGHGYNGSITRTTPATDPNGNKLELAFSWLDNSALAHIELRTPRITCGKTYYVRATVTTSGNKSYSSGEKTVTTPCSPPSVATLSVNSVTNNSAIFVGDLTGMSGASSLDVGFLYNRQGWLGISTKLITKTSTGTFVTPVANLNCGEKYYVQAYVNTPSGRFYGNQHQFTTALCNSSPAVSTEDPKRTGGILARFTPYYQGVLTFLGGYPSAKIGFEHGPTSSYGNTLVVSSSSNIGPFDTAGVCNHHYRAFAETPSGIAYGIDQIADCFNITNNPNNNNPTYLPPQCELTNTDGGLTLGSGSLEGCLLDDATQQKLDDYFSALFSEPEGEDGDTSVSFKVNDANSTLVEEGDSITLSWSIKNIEPNTCIGTSSNNHKNWSGDVKPPLEDTPKDTIMYYSEVIPNIQPPETFTLSGCRDLNQDVLEDIVVSVNSVNSITPLQTTGTATPSKKAPVWEEF